MIDVDYKRYKKGKYRYILNSDFTLKTWVKPRKKIEHPYISLSRAGNITIKKDYAWDGATGVPGGWQTKALINASLVHDAFCQMIELNILPFDRRRQADKFFKEICIRRGMNKLLAHILYKIIRIYVLIKYPGQ